MYLASSDGVVAKIEYLKHITSKYFRRQGGKGVRKWGERGETQCFPLSFPMQSQILVIFAWGWDVRLQGNCSPMVLRSPVACDSGVR